MASVVTDEGALRAAVLPGCTATSLRLARVGQAGAQRRSHYRTGLKRLSVEVLGLPGGGARWGTDVPYAAFNEFGTYKMSAQPFVRPSADDLRGAL